MCRKRCFLLLLWQLVSQPEMRIHVVLWNESIMAKIVCKKQVASVYTLRVWMYACVHVLHTVAYLVCVHVLQAFVHMFVLRKGLLESRPFVVGRSGLPTQLVWVMDVSRSCISLRPETDCPTWCEPPTNVPTLTTLNRNWYKHQICLTCASCCQSIYNYIDATQKLAGEQVKSKHGKKQSSKVDFTS